MQLDVGSEPPFRHAYTKDIGSESVYTKFAGHAGQVRRKPKMSGEGLLLNSIKCPAKRSKCPAKLKKSSCTLVSALHNLLMYRTFKHIQ